MPTGKDGDTNIDANANRNADEYNGEPDDYSVSNADKHSGTYEYEGVADKHGIVYTYHFIDGTPVHSNWDGDVPASKAHTEAYGLRHTHAHINRWVHKHTSSHID